MIVNETVDAPRLLKLCREIEEKGKYGLIPLEHRIAAEGGGNVSLPPPLTVLREG